MNFYSIIVLFTMLLQPFLCTSSEDRRVVRAKRQLRQKSAVENYTPTQCLGDLQAFIAKNLSKSLELHEQDSVVAILLQKPESPAHKSLSLQPTEEKQENVAKTIIAHTPAESKSQPPKDSKPKKKVSSISAPSVSSPKVKLPDKQSSTPVTLSAVAKTIRQNVETYVKGNVDPNNNKKLQDALESLENSLRSMDKAYHQQTEDKPTSLTKNNPLPISKQRLKARDSLFKDYGVTTKENLSVRLSHVCLAIHAGIQKNDSLSGPYFDTSKHMLYGPINYPDWSFIFSPCTGNYTLHNISFCNLPNSDMVKDFRCQLPNCTYFEGEIKIIDYEEFSESLQKNNKYLSRSTSHTSPSTESNRDGSRSESDEY